MGTLSAVRDSIVTDLTTASIRAYNHQPERLTPPVVLVEPGEPYISPAPGPNVPFGFVVVNVSLLLAVGTGTNSKSIDALDTLIENVIAALPDWDVDNVQRPGQVEFNGASYLGTVMSINKVVSL